VKADKRIAHDLSKMDTSPIDGVVMTRTIFLFSTVIILALMAGIKANMKYPKVIIQPVVTFIALRAICITGLSLFSSHSSEWLFV